MGANSERLAIVHFYAGRFREAAPEGAVGAFSTIEHPRDPWQVAYELPEVLLLVVRGTRLATATIAT